MHCNAYNYNNDEVNASARLIKNLVCTSWWMHIYAPLFALMLAVNCLVAYRPVFRSRLRTIVARAFVDNAAQAEEYSYHVPVMKEECCTHLKITPGGVYVDCTLGGGGHTKAILERGGKVIGLDQDPDAIARASAMLSKYIERGDCEIMQTNFRNIKKAIINSTLAGADTNKGGLVDGVLMDLGVSSFQINEGTRGFSISQDGPLDMRMNKGQTTNIGDDDNSAGADQEITWRGKRVISAQEILNTWDTAAIADVLYNYGDETRSRILAREIVAARPLNTTADLVRVISSRTSFKERPKTLARCFQALRIVVNDEIGALEDALSGMHECLRDGGAFVVMSYHSLEDRRVKQLFRTGSLFRDDGELGEEEGRAITTSNPWEVQFKGAIGPSDAEVEANRRARSAKLRAAVRVPRIASAAEGSISARGKKKGGFIGAKQRAKLQASGVLSDDLPLR